MSTRPSPSKSAAVAKRQSPPAISAKDVSNELVVSVPAVATLWKTDTRLPLTSHAIKSSFPSPSKSTARRRYGFPPVPLLGKGRSTRGANEAALNTAPFVLMFRKMETTCASPLTSAMSGLPSPSKSAMTLEPGPPPVARLKLGAKLLPLMLELSPLNVGSNGWLELATNPFTDTVIGANVAPVGTVTVRLVGVADDTMARTRTEERRVGQK